VKWDDKVAQEIADYAVDKLGASPARTIEHFKARYGGNLKESTVRGWITEEKARRAAKEQAKKTGAEAPKEVTDQFLGNSKGGHPGILTGRAQAWASAKIPAPAMVFSRIDFFPALVFSRISFFPH